jgi:MoaA/NifB/PqqE/SkfB family radical SAM enzyme
MGSVPRPQRGSHPAEDHLSHFSKRLVPGHSQQDSPSTHFRWPGAELRWLARIAKSHRVRPNQPFKLTFAVTYACQSACTVCNIWKKRPKDELSLDEIRSILRSAPHFSWVDLTGGEPFLRNDIEALAGAVTEECPNLAMLHIPTNGLDPGRIERGILTILERPPRRLIVTVSIDGPPELNVTLRGHPEAWNAAVETFVRLRRLQSRHFGVLIGVTLSAANDGRADEIFDQLRKAIPGLRRSDLHWNFAQESNHFYANTGDLDPGDPQDRYRQLRRVSGDIRPAAADPGTRVADWHPVAIVDRSYRAHLGTFLRTGRSPVPCKSLHSTVFLSPTGELFPCITWDRPLGNLRDHQYNLGNLWRSPAVSEAAAEVRAGNCPQCWTPCEAVPALLGSLPQLIRGAMVHDRD